MSLDRKNALMVVHVVWLQWIVVLVEPLQIVGVLYWKRSLCLWKC